MVEFALVLPLVAALVLVMVNFGKAIYYYEELQQSANEGARLASVSPSSLPGGGTSLAGYLCGQLGNPSSELRAGSSAVQKATVTVAAPQGTIGSPVTVTVATKYNWLPFFGLAQTGIQGKATMRLEQASGPVVAQGTSNATCS